jgi:hypothetical protein
MSCVLVNAIDAATETHLLTERLVGGVHFALPLNHYHYNVPAPDSHGSGSTAPSPRIRSQSTRLNYLHTHAAIETATSAPA